MPCPKCQKELFEVEQGFLALDCCPGCKGLWFDRGELEKIAGIDDAVSKLGAATATELVCPRCDDVLNQHRTGEAIGVDVERCQACGGIWLDRGELEAFRKRERAQRQRPRQKEVLTLKEFLLRFVDSSIDSLKKG